MDDLKSKKIHEKRQKAEKADERVKRAKRKADLVSLKVKFAEDEINKAEELPEECVAKSVEFESDARERVQDASVLVGKEEVSQPGNLPSKQRKLLAADKMKHLCLGYKRCQVELKYLCYFNVILMGLLLGLFFRMAAVQFSKNAPAKPHDDSSPGNLLPSDKLDNSFTPDSSGDSLNPPKDVDDFLFFPEIGEPLNSENTDQSSPAEESDVKPLSSVKDDAKSATSEPSIGNETQESGEGAATSEGNATKPKAPAEDLPTVKTGAIMSMKPLMSLWKVITDVLKGVLSIFIKCKN